jgi:hypothetical protein
MPEFLYGIGARIKRRMRIALSLQALDAGVL